MATDKKIRVDGPDGPVYFAEGTSDAEIDKAMSAMHSDASYSSRANQFTPSNEKDAAYTPAYLGKQIDNTVRGIANGATFNWADEAAAGMGAATGVGGDFGEYSKNLDAERKRNQIAKEETPYGYGVGEIVGGVISPLNKIAAPFEVAQGASFIPRYAKYIGNGAIGGAIAGTGAGDNGNRLESGLMGTAFGAGFGTVLPGVVELLGKAASSALVRRLSGQTTAAKRSLANAIATDANSVDATNAYDWAEQRLREMGPEASLADIGPNVTGLASSSAAMPGKALAQGTKFLEGRAQGQADRIKQAALRAAGADSTEDLIRLRSQEAAPIYKAAFANNGVQIKSEIIDRLLPDPAIQKGIRQGIRDIEMESRLTGEPMHLADYGLRRNPENGQIEKFGTPTLRQLDAAKRGLDIELQSSKATIRNPQTNQLTQYGMRLEGYRKALVGELDRLTTDANGYSAYKNAREAWGGPTQVINALAHIDKVTNKTVDGRDLTAKLFGSADSRAKVKGLFTADPARSEENMNNFYQMVDAEEQFAANKNKILGNSATAYRTAAQNDMREGQHMTEAAVATARHGIAGGVGAIFDSINRAIKAPPVAVANELSPMLFSNNPQENAIALNALRRRINAHQMIDAFAPTGRSLLTGANRAGGYAGSIPVQNNNQ